jgi:hypothetical protein
MPLPPCRDPFPFSQKIVGRGLPGRGQDAQAADKGGDGRVLGKRGLLAMRAQIPDPSLKNADVQNSGEDNLWPIHNWRLK